MSDQSGTESSSEEETSIEENQLLSNSNEKSITEALEDDDNNSTEPKLGMVFNSEEEAFQFYVAHGFRTGFGTVRRSNNTFDGFRYRSTFICSKGGKSRHRPNAKRPPRKKGGKTGCKAKMIVKDAHFQNKWEVIVLELEHNHPLDPGNPKLRKYMKKHPFSKKGKAQDGDLACRSGLNDGLVGTNQEMDYNDGTNATRRLKFSKEEFDVLTEYFDKMQDENPFFFYSLDMNELGQVRNVFWVDARWRAAYQYYGDVINFEIVKFNDRYEDLYLVSFTGTNHHAQTVSLGSGFISGKTTGTFLWIFNTLLRCMDEKSPVALITEINKELDLAIKKIFPEIKHRFCLFQILKDLPEKLQGVENLDTFIFRLTNVIFDSQTVPDFEKEWGELVRQFNISNNEWFLNLFEVRKQWAPVYVKDYFWASLSVTERGETVISYFDGFLNQETTLKSFLEKYENKSKLSAEKEEFEDLRSLQMRPQIISGIPFEEQISKVYTPEMFRKFQTEVKELFQMSGVLVDRSGTVVSYVVSEINNGRKLGFRVAYDSVEEDIWCMCRSFQHRGILCRHALSVLRQEIVMLIPNKYIIARWRKDFKRLLATSSALSLQPNQENQEQQKHVGYDDLYSLAHRDFIKVVDLGGGDKKDRAISVLKESMDKVISYEKSLRESRMRLDADITPTSSTITYNLINEDFTDDLSPITLSTRGWDPTMPQPKKKRKKIPGLSVSALGALKSGKKKVVKSKGVGTSANVNVNEVINVQQMNEGWSLTPGGAQENYPYGVETISFDLSHYNGAPGFQWPDTRGSRLI